MKKKKIPWKNNLVTVKKIARFIRGLTAENTNCQISQNPARFGTFKIALSASESLVDLKYCIKPYHQRPFFWVILKKLQNFPKKQWNFNDTQTRWRLSSKKLCVLSLLYNSRTLLSAVFVWGLKFTNRQFDRKTFEVDKWVLLEIPTGQELKLRQSRYQWTSVIVSRENILISEKFHQKFSTAVQLALIT